MNSISTIQKKRFFDEGNELPTCINQGCNNNVAVRNWGNWSFKSECSRCATDRKRGIIREGIVIHKKKYCENIDGHLGFKCPVPTKESWMGFEVGCLDLDHVDGNHDNNEPDNVKTYCKICHSRKSLENGDCSNKKDSARSFN
jgi:hypothetical protein